MNQKEYTQSNARLDESDCGSVREALTSCLWSGFFRFRTDLLVQTDSIDSIVLVKNDDRVMCTGFNGVSPMPI